MLTQIKEEKSKFHHEKGVTYFNKRAERTIFFIMTLAMLGWGLIEGIAGLRTGG